MTPVNTKSGNKNLKFTFPLLFLFAVLSNVRFYFLNRAFLNNNRKTSASAFFKSPADKPKKEFPLTGNSGTFLKQKVN
jgi:hypothetical protein